MSDQKEINPNTKHLILCEGIDEKLFFIWYLDYFKRKSALDYNKYNEIQLEDIGGNEGITKQLGVWILASGYENLKTIGIIRDAEKNSSGALQAIQNCFSTNDLPVPQDCFELTGNNNSIKTVFGILPGTKTNSKWDNGTLEDLCLKVLKDPRSLEKINSISIYLDQAQEDFEYKIRHTHKAKLHTFFSSNEPFIGLKSVKPPRVARLILKVMRWLILRKCLMIWLISHDISLMNTSRSHLEVGIQFPFKCL